MDLAVYLIRKLREDARLPEAIYHYTSAEALLSIMQRRVLWATDVRYLNDFQEFIYTLRLASKVVSRLATEDRHSFDAETLTQCERALRFIQSAKVYAASFSGDGDLLSQWRAYCPPAGGFSIGFPPEAVAHVSRCFLVPCVYEPKEQERLLKWMLSMWVRRLREPLPPDAQFQGRQHIMLANLERGFLIFASVFKHPGFREEQEWRLVTYDRRRDIPERQIRTGRSGLVPYVELPLQQPQYAMWVRRLIVGPNAHQHLAEDAARALLTANRITFDSLRCSKIPYRTW